MELPFQVAKKGLRPPALEHCPPSMNELMRKCWEDKSERRPSMAELQDMLEDQVNKELVEAKCMEDGNPKIIDNKSASEHTT